MNKEVIVVIYEFLERNKDYSEESLITTETIGVFDSIEAARNKIESMIGAIKFNESTLTYYISDSETIYLKTFELNTLYAFLGIDKSSN